MSMSFMSLSTVALAKGSDRSILSIHFVSIAPFSKAQIDIKQRTNQVRQILECFAVFDLPDLEIQPLIANACTRRLVRSLSRDRAWSQRYGNFLPAHLSIHSFNMCRLTLASMGHYHHVKRQNSSAAEREKRVTYLTTLHSSRLKP